LSIVSYPEALSYSLKLLSGRQRSSAGILALLRRKGCPMAEAQKVVNRLEELGLLNDMKMAEQIRDDTIRTRPGGRRHLRQILRRKHIPTAVTNELVNEIDDEEEAKRATDLGMHWLDKWKALPRDRRRKRIYDLLVRRGFDYELCRDVIDHIP